MKYYLVPFGRYHLVKINHHLVNIQQRKTKRGQKIVHV